MGPPVLLTHPDDVEAHVAGWHDLAARLPWTSYFCTPDWQLTWWRLLAPERRGLVAVWPGPQGLEAVVGLAHGRLHPRVPWPRGWTALGSGPGAADHLGWPVLPHREDDVRRWLAQTVGRRPVLLPNLDPDSGSETLLPGATRGSTTPCPRLSLEGHVPPASGSQRSTMRRKARRVQEAGVTISWHGPGELGAEVLDELLRLHAARAAEQGWSTTFTPARREVHLALMARSAPDRGPAAVVARDGDRVVGVCYGFLWNGTFSYYQLGWDAAYAPLALGSVLLTSAMELARDHGCVVFDLLRGDEPFKYRFGAEDRVDTTWISGQGVASRLIRRRNP